jgi:hypothetical protein
LNSIFFLLASSTISLSARVTPIEAQVTYPQGFQVPYSKKIEQQHSIQVGNSRGGCAIWLNPRGKAQGAYGTYAGSYIDSTVLFTRRGEGTGTACSGVFEVRKVTVFCRSGSVTIAEWQPWTTEGVVSRRVTQALCQPPKRNT